MNKLTTICILLLGLSFSVMAEMKDRPHTASGSQMPSSSSTQMMSREMMRNMAMIMQQMQLMTRDMNRIMEKSQTMHQTRSREMARIMEQLSQAMHKMSQHMQKGEMDKNMLREMERHMNQINKMIKEMGQ